MSNAKTATEQYVDETIDANVTGKADKAVPSAAGNLASLTAQGNLADSTVKPSDFAPATHAADTTIHHTEADIGAIAAEKVAAVVAGAPSALDTLKEIAEVIGTESGSGAGGILKRVSDLEDGKVDKIQGKGLSTNDYTDAEKEKVANALTQHQDISGKQDALTFDSAPTADSNNPVKSGGVYMALQGKANSTDLPYAMVTPGEWEFSGGSFGQGYYIIISPDGQGGYNYDLYLAEDDTFITEENKPTDGVLSVFFEAAEMTATRASLPGQLLDRANNLIDATTGNVTLTLPPFVAGKVRDMLVACTIGLDTNDEPWSVIFQGGDGEEISFKAEGDDAASATFPVPDAAGDWWYSITERAPHVFAVSLKQLQSVSQPTQTQGGS